MTSTRGPSGASSGNVEEAACFDRSGPRGRCRGSRSMPTSAPDSPTVEMPMAAPVVEPLAGTCGDGSRGAPPQPDDDHDRRRHAAGGLCTGFSSTRPSQHLATLAHELSLLQFDPHAGAVRGDGAREPHAVRHPPHRRLSADRADRQGARAVPARAAAGAHCRCRPTRCRCWPTPSTGSRRSSTRQGARGASPRRTTRSTRRDPAGAR